MWGRIQAEMEAREGQKGMSPYDLLELPRAQRNLMRKLLKQRVISLQDAADELQQSEQETEQVLDALVERTFLLECQIQGQKHYKILLARKEGKELPFNLWDDLSHKLEG
jgi:hypothetical protein